MGVELLTPASTVHILNPTNKMLSLHRTGLEHPWFARPVKNNHEFLHTVSDESAASTTSTEEYSIYKSYQKSSKKVSESRPRSSATSHTYGDYLDLPSGKDLDVQIFGI